MVTIITQCTYTIFMTIGAQTPGAPVWISDMKKGGAAYR